MSELFDRVDMGLLWLDESGRIGLCNRWLSEAARWPAPPLGQTLEQAFGPELSPKLVQAVDEALRRGRSVRLCRGSRACRRAERPAATASPAHAAGSVL